MELRKFKNESELLAWKDSCKKRRVQIFNIEVPTHYPVIIVYIEHDATRDNPSIICGNVIYQEDFENTKQIINRENKEYYE